MDLSFVKNKFSQHGVFAKHSLILFTGTMLVNFFNYVYHFVIGRIVSVEVYGEAESLISFVAVISVFSMTLSMVATKYVASCKAGGNKEGLEKIHQYLNRRVLKYGLPLFALAVLATPLVGKFFNISNSKALILVWMMMLVSFFCSVNSGVFSGWQKFRYISLSGVSGAAMKLISGVILVKLGFALNGIVGSFLLASITTYFVSGFIIKHVILKNGEVQNTSENSVAVDFRTIKEYIMPVFVGNLAVTMMCNLDMILAKHNLDAVSAGQYGALNATSKVIYFGTGIVASVLFSMSAEKNQSGNSSKPILKIALALVGLASIFAVAIYALFPKLILSILYGSKYQDVAMHLGWFAIAVSLFSILNVIYQYFMSIHKTKISYALIPIALFLAILLLLYGKSITAIIFIVIIIQILAILTGVFFLLKEKRAINF